MVIAVKVISIVIAGMGVIYLLNPKALAQVMTFFSEGKRLYLAAVLRLVIGSILLIAASRCRVMGFVVILGILTLLGSITIFTLGPERVKPFLDWWSKRSFIFLRFIGLLALAVGVLLLYAA